MKSLYDRGIADELTRRLETLEPGTPSLWGKMDAAQMLAHCAVSVQMALGEVTPKRSLIGRLIGPMLRSIAFNDKPLRKSNPTAPELMVQDKRDLDLEREKLSQLVARFAQGGPKACTREPHCFFGNLTPEEWGKGVYKHLDHHLRQFGA